MKSIEWGSSAFNQANDQQAIDNGPTGKKFTESLHERKNNGKFEESTKNSRHHDDD